MSKERVLWVSLIYYKFFDISEAMDATSSNCGWLVSATTEVAGAGPEQVVGDDGGSPADVTEGGAGSRHGAQNQQGTDAQLFHVR